MFNSPEWKDQLAASNLCSFDQIICNTLLCSQVNSKWTHFFSWSFCDSYFFSITCGFKNDWFVPKFAQKRIKKSMFLNFYFCKLQSKLQFCCSKSFVKRKKNFWHFNWSFNCLFSLSQTQTKFRIKSPNTHKQYRGKNMNFSWDNSGENFISAN